MVDPKITANTAVRPDRFRAKYALVFACRLLLMQFCGRVADFNKLPNLGFLLFLIYLFTIGLYFLALCVYKLALDHWRQLISVVIAPFVMFGILYFQVRSDLSPNYLHFLIMRPWYFATVGQLTTDDAFHAWFWGSTQGLRMRFLSPAAP